MLQVLSYLIHFATAFALSWWITDLLMPLFGFGFAYALALVASYFLTLIVIASLSATLDWLAHAHLPDRVI